VTLVFHNFWAAPAQQQQLELGNFLKNLSIAGGLLIVFGRGAGAFSIDARRSPDAAFDATGQGSRAA
jgi:putative oxidoreductase